MSAQQAQVRTPESRESEAEPGHEQHARPRHTGRSPAEWTTLTIVLLLLAAVVGALLWFAVRPGEDTATFDVEVEASAIEQREGHFYVPLRVRNTGKATAEDVIVRAAIIEGGEAIEETELTFRFVAGGEEAEGVAVFTKDPRRATLEVRVASYLRP